MCIFYKDIDSNTNIKCPKCGSSNIMIRKKTRRHGYGWGPSSLFIPKDIVICKCKDCKNKWEIKNKDLDQ
ncbi:MAG: hypothetical protein LBM76_02605 [Mycoplasmataceae bacterium]|nr:hypothetical protein [Mycoplasmataceae bacterium]